MKLSPKRLPWLIGIYLLISILLFSFSVLIVTNYNANLVIEKELMNSLKHRHTLIDSILEARLDRLGFALIEIENRHAYSLGICSNPLLDSQAHLRSISRENASVKLDLLLVSRIDGSLCIDASSRFFSFKPLLSEIIKRSSVAQSGQVLQFKKDRFHLSILLKSKRLISTRTGEYIGTLIGGQVLNNNLSLLELIRQKTKSDAVGFFNNGILIGSTDRLASELTKSLVSGRKSGTLEDFYFNSNSASQSPGSTWNMSYGRGVIKGQPTALEIGLATTDTTFYTLRNIFWKSGLFLLFALILFFGLTIYATSRFFIPPLRNLLGYSADVSAGRVKSRYKPSVVKEFNEIGQAMEVMVANLNAGNEKLLEEISERKIVEAELKNLNIELDLRVKDRTSELENVNQQLGEKIVAYEQAELELRKFSQAVQQSGSTIVITDLEGTIEFVNPSFSRVTGYNIQEAIGQNPKILKSDRHDTEFYREMWGTISKGETWQGEMINKKKNGELYWEFATISAIKNPSGEITHFFAIKDDISERKQMENELIVAKENAEDANQTKSEFLANMSHELRTPLNSIIGFSQILEMQIASDLNDKQKGFFSNIVNSGHHLLEMVNDILDLAKVEAGKIETDLKPIDFGKMLERSPSVIQAIAYEKKLQIEVNIQPDLGWIMGDETRLKQVIYNLLSNAAKFTPSGKRIGIDAVSEKDMIKVTVWDEGAGIPKNYLGKVFDPFEQVKRGKGSKEKGTGLGLAISRRLVELHQGTITVSSKLGQGSRFTITLPGTISTEEQDTPESTGQPIEISPVSVKNVNILVTEDNETNRELIEAILGDYQLDFAVSGEEAVTMTSAKEYDIILMDIQLPEMDGTNAMKQIRKKSKKHIPIIALTAFAMKGDEEKYLKEGFDGYVTKPIDLKILTKKIEEILG